MTNWQPIETAPKDGLILIAWGTKTTGQMDKPSKEVLEIIRGVVSKAINENDKEEYFFGLHDYMESMKAYLKEKKDLHLADKWLAQLVAE